MTGSYLQLMYYFRNRNLAINNIYFCFIDFQKGVDSVDHNLLFHKLLSIGIHGNMYKAIKCTYEKFSSSNNLKWISNRLVLSCRRHCSNLAPTLFAVFVDDLVSEINRIDKAIHIGTNYVSCPLYADDIVLISYSADCNPKLIV